jgi:hypothetical protein
MTPDEVLALRWVESRLRGWRCPSCGGQWVTARSIVAIFHVCSNHRPVAGRRRPRASEAVQRSAFYNALETALEERAWLDVER